MLSVSLAFLWVAAAASAPQLLITPDAFGPVRFGMTVEEASRVLNHKLVDIPCCGDIAPTPECYYVKGEPELKGVSIVASHGQVKVVTIVGVGYRTTSGIAVGDDETKIMRTYGAKIENSADHYAGTNYFIWSPDKKRALVIQAIGGKVFSLSAGLSSHALGPEGCE